MQLRQRARPAPPGVRGRKGCGHLNYSPAASPAPRVFPSAKGEEYGERRPAGRDDLSSAGQDSGNGTHRFIRFTGSRQLLLLFGNVFTHMMDEVSK